MAPVEIAHYGSIQLDEISLVFYIIFLYNQKEISASQIENGSK